MTVPVPREVCDAVVVGTGPNGLAAAVTLARAGLEVHVLEARPTIGGGARTADLHLADGVVHDLCSSVHPLALASPFFRAFDLAGRGVELIVPDISYSQPLAGRAAGVAYRSLERTADELGRDGEAWRRLMGPIVDAAGTMVETVLGDHRSAPADLLRASALRGATAFARGAIGQGTRAGGRRFSGDTAPALLNGVAAHAIVQLPSLAGAGTALFLGALAHAKGWPIPVGGSQAITDSLVADLRRHGATLITDAPVTHWRQLPRARAYLFDTTPRTLVEVWGQRMRPSVRAAFARFPYGPAAAKVDFVLSGPVPWFDQRLARTAIAHIGGTLADMAAAERDVAHGKLPDRPMVLASDPAAHDPSREIDGLRPLWGYAHVPAGSDTDVTEHVTRRIEAVAPGFRDLIVASRCLPAAHLSRHNPSYIAGDIASGAITLPRLSIGPRLAWDPFAGGISGVYLCSQSTIPGPGVHGMAGWHAARRALKHRFGKEPPPLAP